MEHYLKKRKKNNNQLNQLKEIDDVLAAVNFRLKEIKTTKTHRQKLSLF